MAFSFACLLFWWLPSILLAWFDLPDPIEGATIFASTVALVFFLAGYLVPQAAAGRFRIAPSIIDACEQFAFKTTLLLSVPAFLVGLSFAIYRAGQAYGDGSGIPLVYQAVLYSHLFVGYMYLGSVPSLEGRNRRRVLLVAGLLIFPRLMISLHWSRFFVGQTAVVLLLIAMARGWLYLSFRRWLQMAALAAAIVFVPAFTRGDKLTGDRPNGKPAVVKFLQDGDTLFFFQEDRNLNPECPPLLVSLTRKTFPYTWLHLCTITVGNVRNTPADLGSILTQEYSNDFLRGTGCIYLLELYLTGGMVTVYLGSALFGASCRWLVEHLGYRSLLSGIWAECLVRALFAPRGELGYVYERIPSLLFATLAVIVLSWSGHVLRSSPLPEAHL